MELNLKTTSELLCYINPSRYGGRTAYKEDMRDAVGLARQATETAFVGSQESHTSCPSNLSAAVDGY